MDKKFSGGGLDIKVEEPHVSKVTSWMPISLRGLGINLSVIYDKLTTLNTSKVLQRCSLAQAFRASLWQLTLGLSDMNFSRPTIQVVFLIVMTCT